MAGFGFHRRSNVRIAPPEPPPEPDRMVGGTRRFRQAWLLFLLAVAALFMVSVANAARFNHGSGLGFDYPGDWQLREDGGLLLLLPPGARGGAGQEAVLVGAETVGQAARLDDPAVLQWFDQQMQALFGQVERKGVRMLEPDGARIDYAGAGAERHVVRYRFKRGLGLFVVHVRESEANAPVGQQVFASLGGEFARDRALIGTWARQSTSGTDITYSGDGSAGSFVGSSSTYVYRFAPDGRVHYSADSRIYGQVNSPAGSTVLGGDGDPNVQTGEYVADGHTLWILWADGDWSQWQYRVFDHQGGLALKLTTPGQKKPTYFIRR